MGLNKKGDFTGIFVAIIFIFVIAFISGVYMFAAHQIKDKLLDTEIAKKNITGSIYKNYSDIIKANWGATYNAITTLRWISYFLIIGILMAFLIGCYVVRTKPIYFVPYIFICIIAIIVSVVISNGYEMAIKKDASLYAEYLTMPITNWMLFQLPIIITVVSLVGGIIMYAAWKEFGDVM